MKKLFLLLTLILIIFITGCSSANLTSYVDPDFQDKTFNNLMVFVVIENLELRSKFEKTMVEQFAAYNLKAIASIDVFPPTREVVTEDIPDILNTYNIDGVLQIHITDAQSKTEHYQMPSQTTGHGTVIGNNIYYNTSTYTSDYDINSINLSFEAKIIDSKTAKTAWMASGRTSGSDGLTRISIEKLMTPLAKSLVLKLQEDNLVPQYEE